MNRVLFGAFAALLLAAAGLFWWQGRAAMEVGAALPELPEAVENMALPTESGEGLRGPVPPEASEASREQRRFDRLDRNRDSKIDRVEMLTPRVPQFRKLDTDGNNLLSFEEWAVATSNRFKAADADGNGALSRTEFVKTKPRAKVQPKCRCPAGARRPHPIEPVDPDSDGEE